MGTSTDGLLIYGIALPEEVVLPWSDEGDGDGDASEWWMKESGFVPSFNPFADDGEYAEGVTKGDPRVEVWCDERSAWRKAHPMPVEIHTHCSCEYPMFIVSPHDCKIVASRGDPVLDVTAKATELMTISLARRQNQAREFLKKYIDPLNDNHPSRLEFSWILASLWC